MYFRSRTQRTIRLISLTAIVVACFFVTDQHPLQLFSVPTVAAGVVSDSGLDPAVLKPFPHPYVNGGMSSLGSPFVGIPGDANALNTDVLNAYARYPLVFVNVTPATDIRPDIMAAMRQLNPQQLIFGYLNSTDTWCPQDGNGNNSYPAGSFYRDMWTTISGGTSCTSSSDRFLWFQDGQRTDAVGTNINLAHYVLNPDTSKRYDVAEDEATTIYAHAVATHKLDGQFLDVYCPGILWMETPGQASRTFDYQRAGYGTDNADPANRTAFDLGWQAGFLRLSQHLRELAGPDFPIIGNCAQAPASLHPYLNGWDREDYPFQNGGTFFSNILSWPWGYLHQDQNFLNPQYNVIYSIADGIVGSMNPYTSLNQRKMRYGLGSASLGNGWFLYGDGDNGTLTNADSHYNWWFDEDGVITNVLQSDPTYGHAAEGAQYGGWLGNPQSPAYNVLATNFGSVPDLLSTNQGFETAGADPSTIPGWTNFFGQGFSGNTIVRDTTTAAAGQASAKVTVTTTDATNADLTSLITGSYSIAPSTQYTVSFKAKASSSLPINVELGSYAHQTVRADTQWRQYQAVITSSIGQFPATLRLGFALQAGTYWIDDVHVQQGETGLWRRDFDKGIVLVNPNSSAITVTLEKPYQKIAGTVNPTLNTGSMVSQVTLAGTSSDGGTGDALFLLSVDHVAPSAVTDLRAP